MTLPGLSHSITLERYGLTVDAEGTPIGGEAVVVTTPGYVHIYNSQEIAASATLGDIAIGRALVPYGVTVHDQDILRVTYADGSTDRFRVIRARDNHFLLRLDLASETV